MSYEIRSYYFFDDIHSYKTQQSEKENWSMNDE